jgi:hypothetical protein
MIVNLDGNKDISVIISFYTFRMNIFKKWFNPTSGREKGSVLLIYLDA